MRRARLFVILPTLLLASASPVLGQVEGVWKLSELSVETPDTSFVDSDPGPLYYIFAHGHYIVSGHRRERGSLGEDPTDAQLVEAWRPWIGNVGSYSVSGETLVLSTIVAKNPNADTEPRERSLSVVGDVMSTWWTSPNGSKIKTTWRRVR